MPGAALTLSLTLTQVRRALDEAVATERGTFEAVDALMTPHPYEASPLRKKQRPSDHVSGLKELANHAVTVASLTRQQMEQAESMLVMHAERVSAAPVDQSLTHQYRKHAEAVQSAVRAAADRQRDVCQRMIKKLQVAARTAAAKTEAEHQRAAQELQEMQVCERHNSHMFLHHRSTRHGKRRRKAV